MSLHVFVLAFNKSEIGTSIDPGQGNGPGTHQTMHRPSDGTRATARGPEGTSRSSSSDVEAHDSIVYDENPGQIWPHMDPVQRTLTLREQTDAARRRYFMDVAKDEEQYLDLLRAAQIERKPRQNTWDTRAGTPNPGPAKTRRTWRKTSTPRQATRTPSSGSRSTARERSSETPVEPSGASINSSLIVRFPPPQQLPPYLSCSFIPSSASARASTQTATKHSDPP